MNHQRTALRAQGFRGLGFRGFEFREGLRGSRVQGFRVPYYDFLIEVRNKKVGSLG